MPKRLPATLPLVAAIMLSVCVLAVGCGGAGSNTTTQATSSQPTTTTPAPTTTTAPPTTSVATTTVPTTRTVKDKDGNPVEIPYVVERVAPQIGAMAHMTALLGCADKIVCAADSNLNATFRKIFPQYVQANPKGLSTSNVEDVIASHTQVLYGPITDQATIDKYRAAGIAVVPINTFSTVDQMKENIRLIAQILGGDAPAKAEAFCEYYDAQIKYCTDTTARLAKVTILSLSINAGAMSTINSSDICSVYMTAAGGINVAANLSVVSGISAENVIQWNPQVIITMNASSMQKILTDPTLQTVEAVRNRQVYIIPWGTYLWAVRSAEGAMMPLWLTTILHPGLVGGLDMNQVVRDYYSRFYGYNISDTEIASFLAGSQQ